MSGWSTIPPLGETVAVDPSVAEPVLEAAAARGWRITQVWNTHWHPDHTGGNDTIRAATGCTITGPGRGGEGVEARPHRRRRRPRPDRRDRGRAARHPRPHRRPCRLPFAGGRDRVHRRHSVRDGLRPPVRGTAAQMHDALQRLAALPPETRVYCGHEYTLANGRFALSVEPDNQALIERMAEVEALRARGEVDVADHHRAGARDQPLHARPLGRGACRTAGGEGRVLVPNRHPALDPGSDLLLWLGWTRRWMPDPRPGLTIGEWPDVSACTARPAARRTPP